MFLIGTEQERNELMRLGPLEDRVLWLGIMPNASMEESKYLYIALPSKIIRYDTFEEGIAREIRFPVAGGESFFRSATLVPPSQLAVGMTDGSVVLIDVWTGTTLNRSQKGHSGAVLDISFDSQSQTLLTVSDDKALKIWTLAELSAPVRSYSMGTSGCNPYSLAVSGGFVFVGIKQEKVLLYSLPSLLAGVAELLEKWPHPTSVTSLRVLEGTLVAVSGETVFLWSISDRRSMGVLEPTGGFIKAMEITSTRIFCGGTDNCITSYRYQTKLVSRVKEAARHKDKGIDLSYCQLTNFPTILTYAKWIQSLNLARNSFTKLPHEIGLLTHLNTLVLSSNQLDSLPDEIALLAPSLTNLQLDDNKFKMVPLVIASLNNLKVLNLAHNQLSFLLPFLCKLPLTTLDVSVNPLEDPGPDIAKAGIHAILDYLSLKASTVPVAVNRVKIMLVGNENVGKTSLVLNLRHKSSLFSARPNIKTLSTQGISIETVSTTSGGEKSSSGSGSASSSRSGSGASSSGVGGIGSIGSDGALSNQGGASNGGSAGSYGNGTNLSARSEPKLTMNIAAQLAGLGSRDKKKDGKRKVKWYTWDFGGQEVYYHTHQFFITPHSIYILAFDVTKPLDENNILFWLRCIRARTSTSRGSHSYSGDSTANRSPVPIVLVATHTDSFDRTQLPWMQDLFLDNSKEKMAFLTKKDETFLETYYTWIYKKFSPEHPSIKLVTGVSSKTGKGVKELKHALREICESSPSIKNQVNSVVHERVFLLEQIIQRAKSAKMPPFLTWQEYSTLASGCIDDTSELLEATKLLANLGSLVYLPSSSRKNSWMVSMAQLFPEDYETYNGASGYGSHGGGSEFVVLDPQWLVDLFATILGTSPNFVRNGMIRSQDLKQIWRDHSKYPPDMHKELMLILEHFDVAFALGSKRKHTFEANPVLSGLPAPKLRDIARMSQAPSPSAASSVLPTSPVYHNFNISNRHQKTRSLNLEHTSTIMVREGNLPAPGVASVESEAPTHLFPSLLPTAKPQLDILWPAHEHRFQVDRIYTFPRFLPLGLFSRFMVRLLSYFPAYYYWRQGVIISDETKRAYSLIEEIPEENKVIITVRGPVNTVSVFLSSVMDIWSKLVADMYDITIVMTTTCYHCTAARIPVNERHIFDVSMCESILLSGERFCACKNGGVVRLDQLCPDLCLVNIRALEIDPKELLPWGADPPDGGIVGEGGFGVVYRKSYKGKKVAVKKLKEIEKQGMLTPEELAKIHTSFRNEIWLMSGVSHPNIVQLLGFSMRHQSIMVMEFISGGDLYEALISNKSFSWPFRYRIALDIARGMAALHGLNPPLCHSDLKCPNCMMVDWNPMAPIVAKVSDFGLSSRLYGDQLTKTPTTNPFWTAPEILAQLPFDTSADVYSFGVILWNLLSRKALFEEMLPWTDDVSRAVRTGKRPPIPKEPGMIPEYAQLIEDCWEHKPAARPSFVDICIRLEEMIKVHCPEIYPIVEQTRSEMTSNVDNSQLIKSSIFHSTTSPGLFGTSGTSITSVPNHDRMINAGKHNKQPGSLAASGNLNASSSSVPGANQDPLASHPLLAHPANQQAIRASSITNTWAKITSSRNFGENDASVSPNESSMQKQSQTHEASHPTYYNNSKLADYGTTMLKQLKLGSVVTLMSAVGLSQVWAYSPSMGLIYVINSVSGQFVKSFVAPKDLKCMIEVSSNEGGGELWAAGSSGLYIWHGETAQPIAHTTFSEPISSLLFLNKPDRRSVVWAGLANEPKILIWSALTHDLLRTVHLQVPLPTTKNIVEPVPLSILAGVQKAKVKTFTPQPPAPVAGSATSSSSQAAHLGAHSNQSNTNPGSHATTAGTGSSRKRTGSGHDAGGSQTPRNTTSQSPSANTHALSASSPRVGAPELVSGTSNLSASSSTLSGLWGFVGGLVGANNDKEKEKEKEKVRERSKSVNMSSPREVKEKEEKVVAAPSSQAQSATSASVLSDVKSNIDSISIAPRTAASPDGVHGMIRTPECVWAAVGSYLFRLSKSSGALLDGSKSNAELEERERSIAAIDSTSTNSISSVSSSAASSSSSSSAPVTPPSIVFAHPGSTYTLVYAGSSRIWTCGADGALKVWDACTGTLLKCVSGYSPTQLLVVDHTQLWAIQSSGSKYADAWNLETGELVSRIDTGHTAPVNRAMLVFNKTVWTAGQDEAIHVFT